MRTTNSSMSTISPPATAATTIANSSSTPLAAPPASPSLQTASLQGNSALVQAISTAFTASLPAMLSSLREHVGQNTAASGDQTASNLPSQLLSSLISNSTTASAASTTPGSLVVPSFISTSSTLGSPPMFSSQLPATSIAKPPMVVGGSSSGAAAKFSSLHTLSKAFVIGPGYAPVPYKLVAKITGGQFIDLADLLPDNIRAQEIEPQAFLQGKLVVAGSKKRIVEIEDIVTWIEAFTISSMSLCNSFSVRWRDLNQYKLLIIQTAKRFPGKSWLNYDIAFRKDAAATGSTDWSCMNADLFNFHTRSPASLSTTSGPIASSSSTSAELSLFMDGCLQAVARPPLASAVTLGMMDAFVGVFPVGRCKFRHSCDSHMRQGPPQHPLPSTHSFPVYGSSKSP